MNAEQLLRERYGDHRAITRPAIPAPKTPAGDSAQEIARRQQWLADGMLDRPLR